jgi:hypothetical protein
MKVKFCAEDVQRSGGMAPSILNLGNKWRRVASFKSSHSWIQRKLR